MINHRFSRLFVAYLTYFKLKDSHPIILTFILPHFKPALIDTSAWGFGVLGFWGFGSHQ